MAVKVIFITTTGAGTFTIPTDWTDVNSIEVIGGGGGGRTAAGAGAGGGGGGEYRKITNVAGLSGTLNVSVGAAGGVGGNGGDTWFNGTSLASATVSAGGGKGATSATGGLGGTGGVGGSGSAGGPGGLGGATALTGGGGGGAGGPGGVGGTGGAGDNTTAGADFGGGGGSGAGLSTAGGNGGAGTTSAGAGGTNATGGGSGGNGGSGAGVTATAATGMWTSTNLPDGSPSVVGAATGGGGGGGGSGAGNGGDGANYGGAGGGAGNGTGGIGKQGLIIITYTEKVYEDSWHQSLVPPVILSRPDRDALRDRSTFVAIATHIGWFSALSDARFSKTISAAVIAASGMVGPVAPPAPTAPVNIGWFNGLSDPASIRRKNNSGFLQDYADWVSLSASIDWFKDLSEPVRTKTRVSQHQFLALNPTTPSAEIITTDKWFKSFAEPSLRRGISAALQQSTAFCPLPLPPVAVTNITWSNQLSEPVRSKPDRDALRDRATFVARAIHVGWFNGLSEPVRAKRGLNAAYQQYLALNPTTPAAEIITTDKWFAQFRDPVRLKQAATRSEQAALNPFPLPPVAFTNIAWSNQLSEPVRPKPDRDALRDRATFVARAIHVGWFGPLSEPVRVKQGFGARYQQYLALNPTTPATQPVTNIGWFSSLSNPVRRPVRIASDQFSTPLTGSTDVTFGWGEFDGVLSTVTFQYQSRAYTPFTPAAETITADKWYRQFADPLRRISTATRSEQATIGTNPIVSFGWFAGLSDPARVKPGLKAALQPYFSYDPVPFIVSYSWFGELRDPVRPVPRATRYEQQSWSLFVEPNFISFGWFNGLGEPVRRLTRPIPDEYPGYPPITASFSWFNGLRDPVRRVAAPTRYEQQSWSLFVEPVAFSSMGWFGELRDPVRRTKENPGLRVRYPFIASSNHTGWFSPLSVPVRRITDLDILRDYADWVAVAVDVTWFTSLSEPPRRTATATRYEQQSWSLFVQPTVVTVGWLNGLSDPVRRKIDPGFLQDYADWVSLSVSIDWFKDLSEPVRTRKLQTAAQQNPVLGQPPIIASFGWFGSLSDPSRRKPVATRYEQQTWSTSTTIDPTAVLTGWFSALSNPTRRVLLRQSNQVQPVIPTVPTPGSWYSPWREPTPPKRRNPFFTPFSFSPAPVQLSFGWYGNLSLPVRIKPKVWEGQYQAWNPIGTISITYLARMEAYEQRDFLAAVLYAFNPPLRAYVSIIENNPRHRANLGSIVSAVRARVAIITS